MADLPQNPAWAAYRHAIDRLYERPAGVALERGAEGIAPAPDLEARAQTAAERSEELGQSLVPLRASADPGQRELAGIQLLAAAAIDLAVANDLAAWSEGEPSGGDAERGGGLPAVLSDLGPILAAAPGQGIAGLMAPEFAAERSSPASTVEGARQRLQSAAHGALEDICDDAVETAQKALLGLLEIPAPPLKAAAGVALHELATKLGEAASVILRKAAALVLGAIEKILAAIGPEAQKDLREQLGEWVEEIQKGSLLKPVLTRLYEFDRLKQDVDQQIANAPAGPAPAAFNTAADRVEELATRFRKQKKTLEWTIRGLGWTRGWLMGLPPWGPLGLTTGYLTVISYTIYGGGDFLDWYRTDTAGYLNLVDGVRCILKKELA